jgi:hypothetical protein
MLCAGRKQWARASELHMCALTAPSGAQNAIVLDCYKQHVLVSLITSGALPGSIGFGGRVCNGMTDMGNSSY